MPTHKNSILAALAKEDFGTLFTQMTEITLKQRDVLYDVGDPIDYVYFLQVGVASVLTTMLDGSSIEVGMIGFEGVVGFPALFSNDPSSHHIVIQLPGNALRMKIAPFKEAFERDPKLRKLVLHFADMFLNMSTQSAACNRLHSVEQRCARWLLMSSDRAQSNSLPLTQEYLSSMIGVRRSGVTEVAGELQRAGLIRYSPGQITLLDHGGLEKTACECYRLDRDRFDRVLSEAKSVR